MSRFSRIQRVAVTGSTNEDLAAILGDEQARGLTLVADYQQRGSGRKGRTWIAPPGAALLCTIALPDPLPSADLWAVPFWTALLVQAAIRELGADAQLQWPNDLLLERRKVCGILCVSRVAGEYAWAGCGIGVNVRRPQNDAMLEEITPPPAFLSDAVPDADRETLLQAMLRHAERTYDDLAFPDRVARAWERAAGVPGAAYRFLMDGESEPFEATALRLVSGGALLVDAAGVEREVSLADARALR